jgi:hypothetical protein
MMLADDCKLKVSGNFSGPEIDTSILTVVAFVEQCLVVFPETISETNIENEKGLTQKLVIVLNSRAIKGSYPFWFDKEYMETPERGDSPAVDMAAISTEDEGIVIDSKTFKNESFFSLEAKKLPTPGSNREKEYVIGHNNNGAIERFKKCIHGRGLEYSAVIGYIQKNDFRFWHKTINSWIDELIKPKEKFSLWWDKKDKLVFENSNKVTAKLISKHEKINNTYISLYHLWVSL